MTAQEALSIITSEHKWYARYVTDGHPKREADRLREECWLRVSALRILRGTAKDATLKEFFKKFGYEYSSVVTKKV